MARPNRSAEVDEVDRFLAEHKKLSGDFPIWADSNWKAELQATYDIATHDGVVRGQLRFTCKKFLRRYPTINLIFRGKAIWRVDIEDPPVKHDNPAWARSLGLPPHVIGTHEHAWRDNRAHILGLDGEDWDLPCRRPLAPQIRRLPQALAAFAASIHLDIDSEARLFDVPPQGEMM